MTKPKATRPDVPGYGIKNAKAGKGLLTWKWAEERLQKARTYWIGTVRPDGRPHIMPVWGVWFDNAVFFSTGSQSRKAKNLAANASCSIAIEMDFAKRPAKKDQVKDAVVLEGEAALVNDPRTKKKFSTLYEKKYGWNMEGFDEPIYRVQPKVVFGLTSNFTETATRWVWNSR